LVVLVVLLAGCGPAGSSVAPAEYTPPASASPNPATTVTVQRGSIVETVEARGRVVSANEALLSFALEGVLTDIQVSPGDQVDEGEVLAEIESKDREERTAEEQIADAQYGVTVAQLNLELVRGDLAVAQADAKLCQEDLARAETSLRKAQYDYTLASYLVQPNKEPEEESDFTRGQRWALEYASLDYDKAVATCAVREARVEVQKTAVSLAQQSLAQAQRLQTRAQGRAEQAQLQAPFPGVIISWEKRVGERVEAYETIGAVADPEALRMEAWVSEEAVAKVAPGQAVEIILDLRPEQVFAGEVVDVAAESTAWQGKNVYMVDIEFTDAEGIPATIRTGADVVIETRRRVEALLVPNGALYTDGESHFVELVRGGGRVKVEVEVGISDGTHTEILSGLVAGDEVVLP
jgi:multidrug efflux pump subunit AcrA (membrane-fusion protein)